jgi:hypothetical protein
VYNCFLVALMGMNLCCYLVCHPSVQGKLLAVTELSPEPAEASTVHFGFQPAQQADASDRLTHLEVIRQVR